MLKDQADTSLLGRELRHCLIGDQDLPGLRLLKPCDHPQQR